MQIKIKNDIREDVTLDLLQQLDDISKKQLGSIKSLIKIIDALLLVVAFDENYIENLKASYVTAEQLTQAVIRDHEIKRLELIRAIPTEVE